MGKTSSFLHLKTCRILQQLGKFRKSLFRETPTKKLSFLKGTIVNWAVLFSSGISLEITLIIITINNTFIITINNNIIFEFSNDLHHDFLKRVMKIGTFF